MSLELGWLEGTAVYSDGAVVSATFQHGPGPHADAKVALSRRGFEWHADAAHGGANKYFRGPNFNEVRSVAIAYCEGRLDAVAAEAAVQARDLRAMFGEIRAIMPSIAPHGIGLVFKEAHKRFGSHCDGSALALAERVASIAVQTEPQGYPKMGIAKVEQCFRPIEADLRAMLSKPCSAGSVDQALQDVAREHLKNAAHRLACIAHDKVWRIVDAPIKVDIQGGHASAADVAAAIKKGLTPPIGAGDVVRLASDPSDSFTPRTVTSVRMREGEDVGREEVCSLVWTAPSGEIVSAFQIPIASLVLVRKAGATA